MFTLSAPCICTGGQAQQYCLSDGQLSPLQMTPGELALAAGNYTPVTHFILLGFSNDPDLQKLLFGGFLLIYTMTVVGNLGMMALILTDSRLHSPMYFFLSILSFLNICYSSVVTPKLLVDLLASDRSISSEGCVVQMTFFVMHATAESFLLASMAYDRCTAICRPLHYGSVMTRGTCLQLVAASYAFGGANSAIETGNVFALPFCGPNQVSPTSVTSNRFSAWPVPAQPRPV